MISGVPDHVDGRMLEIVEQSGGRVINPDRMWHYPEGIHNYASIWSLHGIRILSGPSPLWLDARGHRLPVPLFPGFDTLGALQYITTSGYDHSWFLLNQRIIEREFALSGSEQNPDLTGRSIRLTLARVRPGAPPPVETFKQRGVDFVVRNTLDDLVRGMNDLVGEPLIDPAELKREVRGPRPADRQRLRQRRPGHGHQGGARLSRRPIGARGGASPAARPCGGPSDRRAAVDPHPQDAGRRCRPTCRAASCGEDGSPLPGLYAAGRGGRLRGRRHARLPGAGGHLPRRLHLFWAHSGPCGGTRCAVSGVC